MELDFISMTFILLMISVIIKRYQMNSLIFIDCFETEKNEECISNILKDVDKGVRSCECGVDCEETGYEKEISFSLWPSQKYEVIYFDLQYKQY